MCSRTPGWETLHYRTPKKGKMVLNILKESHTVRIGDMGATWETTSEITVAYYSVCEKEPSIYYLFTDTPHALFFFGLGFLFYCLIQRFRIINEGFWHTLLFLRVQWTSLESNHRTRGAVKSSSKPDHKYFGFENHVDFKGQVTDVSAALTRKWTVQQNVRTAKNGKYIGYVLFDVHSSVKGYINIKMFLEEKNNSPSCISKGDRKGDKPGSGDFYRMDTAEVDLDQSLPFQLL